MLSRDEFTRCRGTVGGLATVVATRARWRVDSDSSASEFGKMLEVDMVGEGVIGKTGVEGTMTGNATGESEADDGD